MSSLGQFTGGARVPKVLINSTSTTGSAADTVSVAASQGTKKAASGALTAATLTTVLSVTGSGALTMVACEGVDATSRTHRFKLTLDGVVVYDATTAAVAAVSRGIVLVGSFNNGGASFGLDPVPFNTSCLIEYASSLTETAKTNFAYSYKTY